MFVFKLTLLITIFYGMLYSMLDPGDFGFKEKIDPFYFSLTTMTSVGYGDFSPKTTRAKMLVMSQQIILLFEVALISLYAITKNKRLARV